MFRGDFPQRNGRYSDGTEDLRAVSVEDDHEWRPRILEGLEGDESHVPLDRDECCLVPGLEEVEHA